MYNVRTLYVQCPLGYDHVGIRASIFEDDISGLDERISKARCSLKVLQYSIAAPLVSSVGCRWSD